MARICIYSATSLCVTWQLKFKEKKNKKENRKQFALSFVAWQLKLKEEQNGRKKTENVLPQASEFNDIV